MHAVQTSWRFRRSLDLDLSELGVVAHAGTRYQRRIDEDRGSMLTQISIGRRSDGDAIELEEGNAFAGLRLRKQTCGLLTISAPSSPPMIGPVSIRVRNDY